MIVGTCASCAWAGPNPSRIASAADKIILHETKAELKPSGPTEVTLTFTAASSEPIVAAAGSRAARALGAIMAITVVAQISPTIGIVRPKPLAAVRYGRKPDTDSHGGGELVRQ